MTYRELLTRLQGLSPEQLDMNVTIHDCNNDEWYPAELLFTTEDDVLDKEHPYLTCKNG